MARQPAYAGPAVTELELVMRNKAIRVRDEHLNGSCLTCVGIGPCVVYSLWFPVIAELPRPEPEWPGGEDPMRWWP